MSAHPCPCGHSTMIHGTVCGILACGCEQSFADLVRGRAKAGSVVTSELLAQVGETTAATFVPNKPTAVDTQVGGSHYLQHSIQPWDIWEEYGLNAFEGAVLKYLLRRKNDRVEDLKKARHTLDRLIEIEEAKGGVLRPQGEEAEQRPGRGER